MRYFIKTKTKHQKAS